MKPDDLVYEFVRNLLRYVYDCRTYPRNDPHRESSSY